MNTHFDHRCERSRIQSAHLISEKACERLGENYPMFLTGDFSCDIESTPYRILTEWGPFTDICNQAIAIRNRFNGTKTELNNETGNERIDWILAKDVSRVERIKIVKEVPEGEYPSDHFPVIAECKL